MQLAASSRRPFVATRPSSNARMTVAPRAVTRGVRAMSVKAEISYVMVKPDGVQRGLVGDIISRWAAGGRRGSSCLAGRAAGSFTAGAKHLSSWQQCSARVRVQSAT